MELNDALAVSKEPITNLHNKALKNEGLLQHPLLDAKRMADRCQFSGTTQPFDRNLILSLWANELIGADNEADRAKWVEGRNREVSWQDILHFRAPSRQPQPPRFHPYRMYPLWRIYRTAKVPLHPIRFPRRDVADAVDPPLHWEHIDGQHSFVNDRLFVERINLISMLAIACEPCSYTQITGRVSYGIGLDPESAQSNRDSFRRELNLGLRSIGTDALETIRIELCRAAQQIEPNVKVQKLLRLCKHEFQMNLKGSLFTAMVFNQMAEIIRRATEAAFEVCLPEEDEVGYLTWNKEARTGIFGTGRPLNAPPRIWKAFLRDLGIDPGIKARVYVEGQTELGAFERLLCGYSHVEIINLAGRVQEKGQMAFLQSLVNDMHKQIFSFIVLDKDRPDNTRAIRKAAVRGEFFGEGYLFQKDFESSAFTDEDKTKAILALARAGGASPEELVTIEKNINFSLGFDALANILRVRYPSLRKLRKGLDWGQALAETILDRYFPTAPEELRAEKNLILKARGRILMASRYDYRQSLRASRVCPETLQLLPRKRH